MKAATDTPRFSLRTTAEGASAERTPNTPSGPAPNFDRLAAVYRWMELASFGPWLQWCRCAFLGELKDSRRALILGDGDGRFTARLLRSNAKVVVDAVDASPAMLQALMTHAGKDGRRVRTQQADIRNWSAAGAWPEPDGDTQPGYDLVVTNFFLDCLTTQEVGELARRVSAAMHPDAVWLVSEFAIPAGWPGQMAHLIVALLYRAFGWLTGLRVRRLPDHRGALQSAGLRCAKRRTFLCGLLVSEIWSTHQVVQNGERTLLRSSGQKSGARITSE